MRKLLVLLCFLIFVPFGAFAEVYSGVCGKRTVNEGKDVVWSCDTETGVLTISGSGKMDSYSIADIKRGINPPWEGTAPYYEDSCVPFIRHVIVEEGVTALGRFSFINLNHLSTISLPEGLESVSYESFGGCITSVTIPTTVKSLDFRAFERCDFIESITLLSSIPIGIDGITDKYFYDQNQIVLKVPDVEAYKNSDWAKYFRRIESIPENGEEMQKVYSGECLGYIAGSMPKPTGISWSLDIESGVLTLSGSGIIPDYSSTGTPWYKYHMYITSVIIDSNVKGIGANTFRNCAFLKSIVIPEGVTYIGPEAFSGCTALSSAIIPESVTEIYYQAFSRCTALSSIIIPESVTSIGENAFRGCSSLALVISLAITPPTLVFYSSPGHFEGIPNNAVLKVPTVEAYKNSPWSWYFKLIEEIPSSGIADVLTDAPDCIFDLTGRRINKETKGQIYIKNGIKYIAK